MATYSYAECLQNSYRVNWKIADVILGREFDLSRRWLPAQLSGAGAAACLAEIEAIRSWSDGRFEGEDCGLLGLASRLRAAPAPAGASGGGDAAPASASGGGAAGMAAVAAGPAGPIANRQQAVARLRELAEWWSRHEPSSPMVPLLNRAVTWSDLDFPSLFALLLRNKGDAKDYMWDVLGLNDREQPPT